MSHADQPERQATVRCRAVTCGFAVAQQPRKPALARRGQLVDVVEEQRARPGLAGWRSRGPGPRGRGRSCRSKRRRTAVRQCRPVQRRGCRGDNRRRRRPRLLKALEQLLRAQPRFRQQQHRRAPGRGQRKRRPRTARGVRSANQWQWHLDRPAAHEPAAAGRHFQSG